MEKTNKPKVGRPKGIKTKTAKPPKESATRPPSERLGLRPPQKKTPVELLPEHDFLAESIDSVLAFSPATVVASGPGLKAEDGLASILVSDLLPNSPVTTGQLMDVVADSDLSAEEVSCFMGGAVSVPNAQKWILAALEGRLSDQPQIKWMLYIMGKLKDTSVILSSRIEVMVEVAINAPTVENTAPEAEEPSESQAPSPLLLSSKKDYVESDKTDIQIGCYLRRGPVIYFNQGGKVYETQKDEIKFFYRNISFGPSLMGQVGGDPEPEGVICGKILPHKTWLRENRMLYIMGSKCYALKDEGQSVIVGLGGSNTTITLLENNDYKVN